MRQRTYKILKWNNRPERTMRVPLNCNGCEREAMLEIGAEGPALLAAKGLGMIFDTNAATPKNRLPNVIKCRSCMREFITGPEE
jgi:hypothetical protein